MSRNKRHNVIDKMLVMKFSLLISFTVFCFAATEITSQLSDKNYKFQMYEEEEIHDSDSDNSNEDDHSTDKYREPYKFISRINPETSVDVWFYEKTKVYKGFEFEIPDPPPEL